MPNCSESFRSGRAARCAVCDGKCGLVHHYSWRTLLCSRKCVDRFRARKGVTALAALPPNRLRPVAGEPREGFMTVNQISQRGKEYLETAQTLYRAAQTMTDRAIAGQLRALADDYQRRAEKASHVDAAKASRSIGC